MRLFSLVAGTQCSRQNDSQYSKDTAIHNLIFQSGHRDAAHKCDCQTHVGSVSHGVIHTVEHRDAVLPRKLLPVPREHIMQYPKSGAGTVAGAAETRGLKAHSSSLET